MAPTFSLPVTLPIPVGLSRESPCMFAETHLSRLGAHFAYPFFEQIHMAGPRWVVEEGDPALRT